MVHQDFQIHTGKDAPFASAVIMREGCDFSEFVVTIVLIVPQNSRVFLDATCTRVDTAPSNGMFLFLLAHNLLNDLKVAVQSCSNKWSCSLCLEMQNVVWPGAGDFLKFGRLLCEVFSPSVDSFASWAKIFHSLVSLDRDRLLSLKSVGPKCSLAVLQWTADGAEREVQRSDSRSERSAGSGEGSTAGRRGARQEEERRPEPPRRGEAEQRDATR